MGHLEAAITTKSGRSSRWLCLSFLLVTSLYVMTALSGCTPEPGSDPPRAVFAEHKKTGSLSLMIVGDYFHNGYILELTLIAQSLSPRGTQIIVCTEKYKQALTPFLTSNGAENVQYVTFHESSPIFTQWARDVAVAGRRGDESAVVVSPYKHATSESEAAQMAHILEGILPDRSIQLAPFVFESGNIAFAQSGDRHILIAGRKVLFDNEVYQKRPWAAGYDSNSLLSAMATTFQVDSVVVVGRATTRPDTRIYFEYHIDMGMAILENNRAIVSQLVYGDPDEAALSRAIADRHNVVTSFLADKKDDRALLDLLSHRLRSVALEYEDYALLLQDLGYMVFRSSVGWQEVLASMSWTNVVQTPGQIVMPLYPDSLRARAKSVTEVGGRLVLALDATDLAGERFELTGRNAENYQLYGELGYTVVSVPEYIHYMMGGVHCFVNIID